MTITPIEAPPMSEGRLYQLSQNTVPIASSDYGMDPVLKAKWVEALRSPLYRKGVGALITQYEGEPVHHCCLGVLCKVAGKDWETLYKDADGTELPLKDFAVLPSELAQEFFGGPGMESGPAVDAPEYGGIYQLTELNDETPLQFPNVADFVDQRVLERKAA